MRMPMIASRISLWSGPKYVPGSMAQNALRTAHPTKPHPVDRQRPRSQAADPGYRGHAVKHDTVVEYPVSDDWCRAWRLPSGDSI